MTLEGWDHMPSSHLLSIEVDLSAIGGNYDLIRQICPGAEVAAVVKADAYGVGMAPIARHLAFKGCRTYFVAHLSEGEALRQALPEAEIYVLNGLIPGTEEAYPKFGLKPVLTSELQLDCWISFCGERSARASAALQIDSGINRLGFRLDEVPTIRSKIDRHGDLFDLMMSHLACADVPAHPRNRSQIDAFTWARRELAGVRRASLAATAGCFLPEDAHFDLVRPGIGLYGGNPFATELNPFYHVVNVSARLLQVKLHRSGEFVGYGDQNKLAADTLVGVISVGYADGLPRHTSRPESEPLHFIYHGHRLPVLGRISMDMTRIDMTAVARMRPEVGRSVQICSAAQPLEVLAEIWGTIPNEVLTSFSRRAERTYFARERCPVLRPARLSGCGPVGSSSDGCPAAAE